MSRAALVCRGRARAAAAVALHGLGSASGRRWGLGTDGGDAGRGATARADAYLRWESAGRCVG
eukprot:1853877-Prymnesium_polylepis.1